MKFTSICFIYQFIVSYSDPPNGEEWKHTDDNLRYGADMVRLIRKEFGDYFCICVAGMCAD